MIRRDGACGLIAYLTCGFPSPEKTVEYALELERAGAVAIELGVPFSDPIADGPVIQAASQEALARGTTIEDVLEIARRIRSRSAIPLIAFSYLNPLMRYGIERFAAAARKSGFDGVLITDLPPEDSGAVRKLIRGNGMHQIFLLAPTSTPQRIALVNKLTTAFIYYVSTTGVTGDRSSLDETLVERLRDLRPRTSHPLAVGFGISISEHYRALAPYCDAVVVGSAIMRAIAEGKGPGDLARSILG